MHNHYVEPGGEDVAAAADVRLLATRGHAVTRFDADNGALTGMSPLAAARATVWNAGARRELRAFFMRERPHVAHFHNTFPLLSPAAYGAARDAGAVVVQTLHNYRLLCPNALLFRDGHVCEDCLRRRVKWPAALHACYRGSRAASAVTATMLAAHSARGTWDRDVDLYVALTEFARRKFVEGGLPADRVVVRPNFVATDPGVGAHRGGYALFVGRLSAEKGIDTLLDAWRLAAPRGRALKVVGAGPLTSTLDRAAGVEFLGALPNADVLALMRDASFLVLPSACYENFPMALAEAFATGLPALVAGHGAPAEIVDDGRTGRHVPPGDPDALAAAIEEAFGDPASLAAMGAAGRREYETRYGADAAYESLIAVYQRARVGATERQ